MKRSVLTALAAGVLILAAVYIFANLGGISGNVVLEGRDVRKPIVDYRGDFELSEADVEFKGGQAEFRYVLTDFSGGEQEIEIYYFIKDASGKRIASGRQDIILGAMKTEEFRGKLDAGALSGIYYFVLSPWNGKDSDWVEKEFFADGSSKISGMVIGGEVKKAAGWVAVFAFLISGLLIVINFIYRHHRRIKREVFNRSTRQFLQFDLD